MLLWKPNKIIFETQCYANIRYEKYKKTTYFNDLALEIFVHTFEIISTMYVFAKEFKNENFLHIINHHSVTWVNY